MTMQFLSKWFRRDATAYWVLLISLAPAVALLLKLQSSTRSQMEARFSDESARVKAGLHQRMEMAFEPVRVVAGFFSADPMSPRSEWDRFADRLGVREGRAVKKLGLTDLGLIWKVGSGERGEKTKQWQALGYSRVQESSRGGGPEAYYTLLLDNFEGRQPLDSGWSLEVESKVRLAMEVARDTGESAATDIVELFHLGTQAYAPGLIMVEPIYSSPKPNDPTSRRQQLLGFAYGSIVSRQPLEDEPGLTKNRLLAWELCGSVDSKALGLRGGLAPGDPPHEPLLRRAETLSLFGRTWQLRFQSLPALERSPERALPWVVFVAGLTISGALFMIALAQSRARKAAEAHAECLHGAEEAILREKRFSEAILNDLPGVFVLLDDSGRLVKWNRFLEEITGLPGSELRALRGGDLFGQGDTSEMQRHLSEVFRKGSAHMEIRLRAKEGKRVPYYFTGYRFQTADKAFCIGIGLDLSEKEKSDREIEHVQQLMRQVIASAQQGMAVFDNSLRCVVWNPHLEKLSGIAAERAAGKTPSALYAPELALQVEARLREVIAGGNPPPISFEARFLSDAAPRWLSVSCGPLTGADGAVVGAIEIARDITEERRLEAEREIMIQRLVENQKYESLGVLAGGIAHDFNNLLAGILGSANLVRMELDPKSTLHTYLQQIEESSKRAATLCLQLLAYAGKGRFQIEGLDLNELVRASSSVLRHSINPQCELKIDLSGEILAVDADTQQIRQALISLVVNSAEAMPESGGVVEISTRMIDASRKLLDSARVGSDLPEGRYVSIQVRDNGAGMEASVLAKIFDPFFSTKFHGRGLGLPSVLGIVRSHHGALRVESTPGIGSSFQILLPRGKMVSLAASKGVRDPELPSPPQPSAKSEANYRILIVDDEPAIREITSRLVAAWGYTVASVGSGKEALELFRANRDFARLVLMDLAMPEMDGATATRQIHAINPGVPVIVMSGFTANQVAPHFSEDTIAAFLQKPFSGADLKVELDRILHHAPA